MYYAERFANREMPRVLQSLQTHAGTAPCMHAREGGSCSSGSGGAIDVHAKLLQWSDLVSKRWQLASGLRQRVRVCGTAPSGSNGSSSLAFSSSLGTTPSSSTSSSSSSSGASAAKSSAPIHRAPLLTLHTCSSAAAKLESEAIWGAVVLAKSATAQLATTVASGFDAVRSQVKALTASVGGAGPALALAPRCPTPRGGVGTSSYALRSCTMRTLVALNTLAFGE